MLLFAFVVSAGLVSAGSAFAEKTVRETLSAPQGALSIACEERIMFGKCILTFRDFILFEEELRLSFDVSAGETDPYYLIHILSGGVSCPAMMMLVDLTDPEAPLLSSEFGTCSDSPEVTVTPKGAFEITLPLWEKEGTARWRYHKGGLRRTR